MHTHDARLKIAANIMESVYHSDDTNTEFRAVMTALSRWLEQSRGAKD